MGQPRWNTTSDRYLTPTAGDAWAAEAAASGQRGTQRILDVRIESALHPISDYLGLRNGAHVVARRRLILADDQPVELVESYWPVSIAGGTALANPEKIPGGAVSLLAELGYSAAEIREDITAMPAREALTASGEATLGVNPDDALLVLTRILLDQTGQPYEASVMTMRPGRRQRYIRQAG